jgi:hypothetical protein
LSGVPGWVVIAAELDALAGWIDAELDDELADRQAIAEITLETIRQIVAGMRRTGGSKGVIK